MAAEGTFAQIVADFGGVSTSDWWYTIFATVILVAIYLGVLYKVFRLTDVQTDPTQRTYKVVVSIIGVALAFITVFQTGFAAWVSQLGIWVGIILFVGAVILFFIFSGRTTAIGLWNARTAYTQAKTGAAGAREGYRQAMNRLRQQRQRMNEEYQEYLRRLQAARQAGQPTPTPPPPGPLPQQPPAAPPATPPTGPPQPGLATSSDPNDPKWNPGGTPGPPGEPVAPLPATVPTKILTPTPPPQRKFIDLSGHFLRAKDQGGLGSCTAFATSALMEYMINRKLGSFQKDLSELFIFHHASGNAVKVMDFTLRSGSCLAYIWPYIETNAGVKPSDKAYGNALDHRFANYKQIPPINGKHTESVISALKDGFPSSLGIDPSVQFMTGNSPCTLSKPLVGGAGHAVVAVGYHPKLKAPGGGTIEAIKLRNCWGVAWGTKGYIWVEINALEDMMYRNPIIIDGWKKAPPGTKKKALEKECDKIVIPELESFFVNAQDVLNKLDEKMELLVPREEYYHFLENFSELSKSANSSNAEKFLKMIEWFEIEEDRFSKSREALGAFTVYLKQNVAELKQQHDAQRAKIAKENKDCLPLFDKYMRAEGENTTLLDLFRILEEENKLDQIEAKFQQFMLDNKVRAEIARIHEMLSSGYITQLDQENQEMLQRIERTIAQFIKEKLEFSNVLMKSIELVQRWIKKAEGDLELIGRKSMQS